MKYYVHHTPGRLRIRIPSLRNNPCKVKKTKTILNVSGTQETTVNPLTGSVVITYDPDRITAQHLLGVLKNNGFYSEDQTVTLDTQLQQASNKAARKVSRAMFGWAIGRMLEANGLSFIAVLI